MPILNLRRQFRELGRIRLGQQVEFEKNGRKMKRPEKLSTFRLTSPTRDLLDVAAGLYGGEVVEWPEAPDGDEWQLVTGTDTLDIVVPPGRPMEQWNEMWGGGGCVRRCDGFRETLSGSPCICEREYPDLALRTEHAGKGEACKPTTRVEVILPRVPDVGTWLLVTHSYYAAVELAGTIALLAAAETQTGETIPAQLWIDQRTVKRQGQKPKHFPVPAIRIPETFANLSAGGSLDAALIGPGRERHEPAEAAPLPEDASIVIEGASAPVAAAPAAPARSRRQSEEPQFARPEREAPKPLTYDQFKYLVLESGMPLERVAEAHKRRFPTGPATRELDDEQRGRLWDELTWTPVLETPAASTSSSEQPATPPAAESAGMTLDELTTALHTANTSFAFAEAKAEELYAERRLDRLDNGQRLAIARELDLLSPQEA